MGARHYIWWSARSHGGREPPLVDGLVDRRWTDRGPMIPNWCSIWKPAEDRCLAGALTPLGPRPRHAHFGMPYDRRRPQTGQGSASRGLSSVRMLGPPQQVTDRRRGDGRFAAGRRS